MINRRSLILGSFACLTISPAQAAANVENLILQQTNAVRRQKGLPALRPSPALRKAAAGYSQVLARSGRFSHNADGTSISDRARKVGYRYKWLAENIAYRSHRADSNQLASLFVESWMNSAGHRRNLLSRKAREVGIGVSARGNRVYAVQFFGSPR
ncbi:CAP domain-containing protein [Halovulum sp. GXIMD14793]